MIRNLQRMVFLQSQELIEKEETISEEVILKWESHYSLPLVYFCYELMSSFYREFSFIDNIIAQGISLIIKGHDQFYPNK